MSKLDRNRKNADIDRMLADLQEPKFVAAECGVNVQTVYRRMRERDLEKAWLTREEKHLIRSKRLRA